MVKRVCKKSPKRRSCSPKRKSPCNRRKSTKKTCKRASPSGTTMSRSGWQEFVRQIKLESHDAISLGVAMKIGSKRKSAAIREMGRDPSVKDVKDYIRNHPIQSSEVKAAK